MVNAEERAEEEQTPACPRNLKKCVRKGGKVTEETV